MQRRRVAAPRASRAGKTALLTFLAVVAIGIVVFGLTTADGIANGLVSAVSLGLVAGVAIALNRRRRGRTRR